MPGIRRGRHVVLSVDQFVPLPVIRKEREIVVGELHPRIERFHRIVPGHRLIVTIGVAREMPQSRTRCGAISRIVRLGTRISQ